MIRTTIGNFRLRWPSGTLLPLKHLAEQHAHQFTRGLTCVLRDFYVDDMGGYIRRIKTNLR